MAAAAALGENLMSAGIALPAEEVAQEPPLAAEIMPQVEQVGALPLASSDLASSSSAPIATVPKKRKRENSMRGDGTLKAKCECGADERRPPGSRARVTHTAECPKKLEQGERKKAKADKKLPSALD